jgi:hypothetical protein
MRQGLSCAWAGLAAALFAAVAVEATGQAPVAAPAAKLDAKACAAMDAPVAAPKNHRIVFENDSVRVLDVVVGVGEREVSHAHCWPSVLYVMFRGKLREWDANGKMVREVTETPPTSSFPQTQWLDVGPPHAMENMDSQPIHLLRVELKR